jgi:hypothetical protein
MGVLDTAVWIGKVLRAIPAPTETWATIISSLVWPAVLIFLVTRYRKFLRIFLDTIASRLQTDHVKLGPFEFTPKSDVIALDPDDVDESTEHYDPQDIQRIERLFEFIADPAGYDRLITWMNEHLGKALDIGDFLTYPEYANQREEAYRAVLEGAES